MGNKIKIKAVSGFGSIFNKLKKEIHQVKEALGMNESEFLKDGTYNKEKLDNMYKGMGVFLRTGFLAIVTASAFFLSSALNISSVPLSAEASGLNPGASVHLELENSSNVGTEYMGNNKPQDDILIHSEFESSSLDVKSISAIRVDENPSDINDKKAEDKLKDSIKRVRSERPDISRNNTMRPGIGNQSY